MMYANVFIVLLNWAERSEPAKKNFNNFCTAEIEKCILLGWETIDKQTISIRIWIK